jgi:hypothetical protein
MYNAHPELFKMQINVYPNNPNNPNRYAGQTQEEQHATQLKQQQIVQQMRHSLTAIASNKPKYPQIQMADVLKEPIVWEALVMLVSLGLALLFVLRMFLYKLHHPQLLQPTHLQHSLHNQNNLLPLLRHST